MPIQQKSVTLSVIRYRGLMDFDGLYEGMAEWFKRYRFKLDESSYKHKVPLPTGADQEIDWSAEIKVTEFVQHKIKVHFHLWDMTEVEVLKDGKKKILTNARLELKISGDVIFDYQKRFEKTKFTRWLLSLWANWLYRREATGGTIWGDMLIYRMYDLHAYAKKFLDMQSQWHSFKGYLGEER